MKIAKKTISILLLISLLLGAFPVSALAENEVLDEPISSARITEIPENFDAVADIEVEDEPAAAEDSISPESAEKGFDAFKCRCGKYYVHIYIGDFWCRAYPIF